ncbi:ATP-dependent DNA helicase PIF1-like [Lineus longissimus]|uniref:ATP-dependent DNA helicase PIF1-like n=1 Tax=Lineus longissimus TaxID=88925 RepID=UPI00315C5C4F
MPQLTLTLPSPNDNNEDFNPAVEKEKADHNTALLNDDQLQIYNAVIQSITSQQPAFYFLDGPGGTGKTFTYNTIMQRVRSTNQPIIVVASSGIASELLEGGRTAHSKFKIPILIQPHSTCSISKNSSLATNIKNAALIVWDEAPMMHKHVFEALHRSLCDIMDVPDNIPFGGKTILLGGDFRQVLPVIRHGKEADVLASSLKNSFLWPNIDYTRAILCPTNEDVDNINNIIINNQPQQTTTYLSTDTLTDTTQRFVYPTEFLNTLTPSGLPPHKLTLQKNTPVLLLRKLDPKNGLLNGTRLRIVNLGQRLLEAEIMTGKKTGKFVFIPRISIIPSDSGLPFDFKRRQFPVKPAYAMTINKSQGQTLSFVGINLTRPVFTHGQLYVAMSRATSLQNICILTATTNDNQYYTRNIVYSSI